jgi:hypothetical protein
MDMFHNINICCRRWLLWTHIIIMCLSYFESLHIFVKFSLTLIVIASLNCHFPLNFTSFHTCWPQKSDHRSLVLFSAYQLLGHIKRFTVLSLLGRQWKRSSESSYSSPWRWSFQCTAKRCNSSTYGTAVPRKPKLHIRSILFIFTILFASEMN